MKRTRVEDDINQKYPLSRLFKDFWNYADGYRNLVVLYFIIILFLSLVALVPTYLYGRIIDDLTKGEYSLIYIFLIITAVAHLVYHILRNYTVYRTKILAARIRNTTRLRTFRYLFNLDYEYYETNPLGQTFSRIDSGTQSVREFVKILFSSTLVKSFGVIFSLVSLFLINWLLGVLAILVVVTYFLWGVGTAQEMVRLDNNINRKSEVIYAKVFDFFSHIKIVKLLNIKEKLLKLLDKSSEEMVATEKISRRYERTSVAVGSLIIELSTVLMLAYLAYLIMNDRLSIGLAVMAFGFYTQCSSHARNVFEDYMTVLAHRTGMYRLSLLYETKPTFEEPTNPKKVSNWKSIRFDDVTFKYPSKDSESLKHVTLEIAKGEKVAIVGLSGSGKSTLAKLLLRLYLPQKGTICIGQTDTKNMSSDELYSMIKIVPQDNELMNASVLENLDMTVDKGVKQEDIIQALKNAHSWDFVKKLPQGINTIVGPDGVKISGGEKQRLCIARALLAEPEILVLDEATSHLDVITERKIYDTLNNISRDTTVIAITHRISSLGLFDKIILFDNGQLVGQGTHKQLSKNKYYARLKSAMKKGLK